MKKGESELGHYDGDWILNIFIANSDECTYEQACGWISVFSYLNGREIQNEMFILGTFDFGVDVVSLFGF